jgi:hypothetical protein
VPYEDDGLAVSAPGGEQKADVLLRLRVIAPAPVGVVESKLGIDDDEGISRRSG